MLTGEFRKSLDDKGRLLLPAKMRNEIIGDILIMTKSMDRCIWLFQPEEWTRFSQAILGSTQLLDPGNRMIERRLIAPAQEVEIDKAGRISVSPYFRGHAKIEKECVVLGVNNRIELWSEPEYDLYNEETELAYQKAVLEMRDKVSF